MTGFILRPVTPADTSLVADLINAHSLAVVGTRRALIDADGDLRTARYIPAAAEQVIAVTGNGPIVAHACWIGRRPHVVIEMGIVLHPDHWTVESGEAVLTEVEARAFQTVQLTPADARVVLQTTILEDDSFAARFLQERGFEPARQWVHFELDLDEAPAIVTPAGVTIRVMDPRADWPAVGAAMDEAFADHWGEMGPGARTLLEEDEDAGNDDDEPADEELDDDPYSNSLGLCFVAEAGGEVIGSCLCNARTVEWPDAGKLGSLSVRRAWRGRGVGHALTAAALAEFHRRGIRRVITDTDNASFTGANRLYPRFGFRPYRYELVLEKELRPGVERRLMSPDSPANREE
jgi:predicted N-acetyltransferase YhbS